MRLLDAGLHPLDDVVPRAFASHVELFDAVVAAEIAAGATFAGAVQEGRQRNPSAMRVEVIAKGAPIPGEAWVVPGAIPAEVDAVLGDFLQGAVNGATLGGRDLLPDVPPITGFVRVTDEVYGPVREAEARLLRAGIREPAP